MRQPSWRDVGEEPDYRFTLANERTFLAWIRTSLSLLAGGVLMHQFVSTLGPRPLIVALSTVLGVVAAALAAVAYTRWRGNEIAIRTGAALPFGIMIPLLSGALLLVSAVIAVLMVFP
ncbi:DUF202 domain-containing protein [Rathayibacter sp. YIM 133350]|uniref:YidH family protein n=1 Tax=Rathayibacter sp. YIM 133350 TaxID=3131992 RepID=UPI00307EE2BD